MDSCGMRSLILQDRHREQQDAIIQMGNLNVKLRTSMTRSMEWKDGTIQKESLKQRSYISRDRKRSTQFIILKCIKGEKCRGEGQGKEGAFSTRSGDKGLHTRAIWEGLENLGGQKIYKITGPIRAVGKGGSLWGIIFPVY